MMKVIPETRHAH